MNRNNKNISIENAKIRFRNFSGKEGRYNPAGRRTFCVLLDPDIAEVLREEGWNIKVLSPRDEGDLPQPYLQVEARFDNFPPRVVLITGSGKTLLDENSINILDWAEIQNVDLTISPSRWEVNGKTGIKAYLKNIYVTIVEDEFEKKYADVPDSAQNSMEIFDVD